MAPLWLAAVLCWGVMPFVIPSLGAETNSEAVAFAELQSAVRSNKKGVVVSDKPLSDKLKKWNQDVGRNSLAVANQAQTFLANFPHSDDVRQATQIEERMLLKAIAAGSTEADKRFGTMLSVKLKSPGLSEDDRFELRALQIEAAHARMNGQPHHKQVAAYEQDAWSLIHEFPGRTEPYLMLLSTVREMMEPPEARATINKLLDATNAPSLVKMLARGTLKGLNVIDHPPGIRFRALDGRQVDTSALKGKVVLLDFWATWCGPCVAEIPHVKEAYKRFHSKGFEVVGISFDRNKKVLQQFVKSRDLSWPQYFDGKGWKNKFGVEFGIEEIPTMWLVNRAGNVVDTAARFGLSGKVARLLGEK